MKIADDKPKLSCESLGMGKTSIEWTDLTWSPIRVRVKADAAEIATVRGYTSLIVIASKMAGHVGQHCEHISPGCEHCYSGTEMGRCLPYNGTGLPFDRRARDLVEPFLDPKKKLDPLGWKTPKRVFVENQSDLFGEWVKDEWLDEVFGVMASCGKHTFQILTKRPVRAAAYLAGKQVPDNIWIGVSAENQETADQRIPILVTINAKVRFVSYEPALAAVDFTKYLHGLHWIIFGGESGAQSVVRMCKLEWARQTISQCRAAGVACFVKQMGSFCFDGTFSRTWKEKGSRMEDWPADVRVRQFPGDKLTYPGDGAATLVSKAEPVKDETGNGFPGLFLVPQPEEEGATSGPEPVKEKPPTFKVEEEPPPTPEQIRRVVPIIERYLRDNANLPNWDHFLPIALWSLATHCNQEFGAFGYLILTSDTPGAGKSRMLELVQKISKDGESDPAGLTLAAMCDTLRKYSEKGGCTIVYDQAEELSGTEKNQLMKCLLSGYTKGATRNIMYRGESLKTNVYGPKAFGLLGDMMEAARDRGVVIPMEILPTTVVWNEVREYARGREINRVCSVAVVGRLKEIKDAVAGYTGSGFLKGRGDQIVMPLLVMCDVFCPERREELERGIADSFSAKRAEPRKIDARKAKRAADAREDAELLARELVGLSREEKGVHDENSLPALLQINNGPWRNHAGVGLTVEKIAELLKIIGVEPRQINLKKNGKWRNRNGYLKADLLAAIERHFNRKTP